MYKYLLVELLWCLCPARVWSWLGTFGQVKAARAGPSKNKISFHVTSVIPQSHIAVSKLFLFLENFTGVNRIEVKQIPFYPGSL